MTDSLPLNHLKRLETFESLETSNLEHKKRQDLLSHTGECHTYTETEMHNVIGAIIQTFRKEYFCDNSLGKRNESMLAEIQVGMLMKNSRSILFKFCSICMCR